MSVSIQTPNGKVNATVDDGFIASAQVDPDGVVTISFYPTERLSEEESAHFIGQ
jgi:hypothetical protein